MLSLNRIVTVRITPDAIQRAKEFAISVTPTVGMPGRGYTDAHQQDLEKIRHDHFVSKVGEEAVKAVCLHLGLQVQGPDYQIYGGNQKSWAADLYIEGVGLAVKTQTATAAQNFGLSWTFQAGAYRYDPILNQPEAWVCFVEFDEQNQSCVVCPPHQIKDLTFGEPKLARLQGSKKVVYATRLPARQLPQPA